MSIALAELSVWLVGMAYIRRSIMDRKADPDWIAILLWQPILILYSAFRLQERIARWAR